MSETCGYGACNPPHRIKIQDRRPAEPGVEIKLAEEDGEVLIRGAVIMAGYRNQPDKTRESIDEDTAGSTPATSASSTRTATSRSSTARRS